MSNSSFKQVIVVRGDLKMGRGKLAVQVAHASLSAAEKLKSVRPDWYRAWLSQGQMKVAVKVMSLDELRQIRTEAEHQGLVAVEVEDRGLTQLPRGTVTCVGIGPAPVGMVEKLTGKLKLL